MTWHIDNAYHPPPWLPGGHVQTIYPALVKRVSRPPYRRLRWDTPDGDFIDLDWVEPATAGETCATLILFHGLEGSSDSVYARALMHACLRCGIRGAVVHFRGCSGEPNRLPRAYHSGDSPEIDWVLRRVASRFARSNLYAAGVSLGGNALLKWLGEQGEAARLVAAAVAVSAPLDLHASGRALERGFARVYARHFLATMKAKARDKHARFPGLFDLQRALRASTLREFDDAVTAPLHGFRGVDDYWTRASSLPGLRLVRVPTLVINARNDPFLPADVLPCKNEVAPDVHLLQPAAGGHVGFVTSPFPGRQDWLAETIIAFLRCA